MIKFNFFKQFITPKWRPLACRPNDIIALFRENLSIDAPMARFIIEHNGMQHRLGMDAEFKLGKWSNIGFYLDDSRFATLEEFCENCVIDGDRFVEIGYISILEDEDGGDPRNNTLLTRKLG